MGVDIDSDSEASRTLFISTRKTDAFKHKSFRQCVPSTSACPRCPTSQQWQFGSRAARQHRRSPSLQLLVSSGHHHSTPCGVPLPLCASCRFNRV